MERIIKTVFALLISLSAAACGPSDNTADSAVLITEEESPPSQSERARETDHRTADEETEGNIMYIKAGDTVLTAELEANSSAEALKEMLAEGDVTVDMSDYGGFEKVGNLGKSLPRNDEQITTSAGDVILYQGDKITIYYDTNSWSFTRLGRIKGVTQKELKKILGSGDVTVTLSLNK